MLLYERWYLLLYIAIVLNGSLGLTRQYEEGVPSVVVELAVVCDKEFSENFSYDQDKIESFLAHEIQDTQVYFHTLRLSVITFRLIYVLIINSSNEQPFIESGRLKGGNISIPTIHKNVQEWAFLDENLINADVIILFTGSNGRYHVRNIDVPSACKYSSIARQLDKLLVIRSRPQMWLPSKYLALALGHALGANIDDKSCTHDHGVMYWREIVNPSGYFFSPCSDTAIRKFVVSAEASCLRNTTKTVVINNYTESSRFPLTIQERCQLEYNKSAETVVADIDSSSCFLTKCFSQTDNQHEHFGSVRPIYNTPCDVLAEHKFCFRGRCLPKGITIKHVNSKKCLLQGNKFTENDTIDLQTCPENPTKHDEFMMLHNAELNILHLATPIATVQNYDKCVTVDGNVRSLLLEKCPHDIHTSTTVTKFGWEFYSVGDNSGDSNFLICHWLARKCLTVDDQLNLVLNDYDLLTDTSYRWKIHNSDDYLNGILNTRLNYNSSSLPRDSKKDQGKWIYITSAVATLVVVSFGIFCLAKFLVGEKKNSDVTSEERKHGLRENFYNGDLDRINFELGVASQAELLPFDRRWEFSEERLTLGKMLGSGAFGCVVMANAIGILNDTTSTTTVAVKMVREANNESHLKALMAELKIMSHIGRHLNIVNLLGACTKNIDNGKLLVIIEFCSNGNLLSYMHRHRNRTATNSPTRSNFICTGKNLFTTEKLLIWAFQIAKGMEYLASRRVLHGDLAARNCLLTDNNVVKICDFGFSKLLHRNCDYNYKKNIKGALLPFKWMAIESIRCGIFNSETDCWSFGVLLWEIFTLGETPYPGLPLDKKFVEELSKGYRMERPSLAPSKVYDMMLQCWADNPSQRPSFPLLVVKLGKMLGDEVSEHYFQLNSDYQQMSSHRVETGSDLLLQMGRSEVRQSYFPTDSEDYLLATAAKIGSELNLRELTSTKMFHENFDD